MWDLGRLRDGLTIMDEAFELLSEDEPDADLAQLAAQIGRFAFFFGDGEVGTRRIEAALAMAEELDLPEVYSQALNTKALILSSHGRIRESRALLREALAVAVEHDKPSAALRAHNNLVDFLSQDNRYAEAQRHVDDGLALARRVGNRYWEQIFLGFIYPRFALGAWSEALASMDELGGWDEHIRSRTAFTQGFVAFGVAIHLHQGDDAGADRLLGVLRDPCRLGGRPGAGGVPDGACHQALVDWRACWRTGGCPGGDGRRRETSGPPTTASPSRGSSRSTRRSPSVTSTEPRP